MNRLKYIFSVSLFALISALAKPANAVIIAVYDFDPNSVSGTQVDIDSSAQTNWTTSILLDNATGTGAISASNQSTVNRDLLTGNTNNYLAISSNRERASDSGDPTGSIANFGESTWFTFDVTPSTGFGFDFTSQTASIDTYAYKTISGSTNTDWTLYYSLDGGTSYTSLGTFIGQGIEDPDTGLAGAQLISWSLDSIGVQTGTVDFLLDPVSTGSTNGIVLQRSTGFDNLTVNALVEDNSTSTSVPFEFSPGLGLVVMMGLWGFSRIVKKPTILENKR